ncbi:sulfatase-like hydrolase/transferase [Rubritalea tangerina]|uniref:Sulfatase-like hydrolase/transferase n=1 Tax=Rubritalea tangerina TaxID=430798 RepID=A0ABW4ZF62_9BACT
MKYPALLSLLLGTTCPSWAALSIQEIASIPANPAINNTGASDGSTAVATDPTKGSKGQSFDFTTNAQLTGIILQMGSPGTIASLDLAIYAADTNGLPTGAAIYSDSGTLPTSGLSSGDYIQIDFATTQNLNAGKYAIVLSTTDSNTNFKLNKQNGYTAGTLIKKNNSSGNAWEALTNGNDLHFALLGSIDGIVDPPPPTRPTASSGPNVIHILVDDWGWTDSSVAAASEGNISDFYETPNIQRLADMGVSFTWCYAQPNCAPTRAAFMTGQYSARSGNGVYNVSSLSRSGGSRTTYLTAAKQGLDDDSSVDDFINGDENTITLAEAMYNAGYVTAHIGKYHVGSSNASDATFPLNQGLDYNYGGGHKGNPDNYFAQGSPRTFHANVGAELDAYADDYTQSYVDTYIKPYENGNDSDTLVGTQKHITDATADAFEDFVATYPTGDLSGYPFYVQYHFYATHGPLQGRPDLVAKYNAKASLTPPSHDTKSSFAALTESMDQAVGRIIDFLDDPNRDGDNADSIASNTVIFFTADNGGSNPETSNYPLRGAKGMHFEGGIRVPLIVAQPGNIPAAKVSNSLVHTVDFYPTILDFAGATYPDASTHPLDGESLYNHLLDPDNVSRDRSPIFYHFPGYMDSRAFASSAVIKQINGKRYKLIYGYDPYYDPTDQYDQFQLYNLSDDLSETVNLMDYVDVENADDSEDPSSSREYWDYILHKDIANELTYDLNAWLVGADKGPTWNPLYATYKDNFPGLDPELVGQETGPSPRSVTDVPIPNTGGFTVATQSVDTSGNLTLNFASHSGFTYQVQVSDSLDSDSWQNLGSPVLADSNSTQINLLDAAAETASKRFYRVMLVQ